MTTVCFGWVSIVTENRRLSSSLENTLFPYIPVLYLKVILVIYSFRSPALHWKEPCCNAAFSLVPARQRGKHRRAETKALQCLPSAAFTFTPFRLSSSPPASLPLHVRLTRGLDESRYLAVENCLGSEWTLCWVICGATQATLSFFQQLAPFMLQDDKRSSRTLGSKLIHFCLSSAAGTCPLCCPPWHYAQ